MGVSTEPRLAEHFGIFFGNAGKLFLVVHGTSTGEPVPDLWLFQRHNPTFQGDQSSLKIAVVLATHTGICQHSSAQFRHALAHRRQ